MNKSFNLFKKSWFGRQNDVMALTDCNLILFTTCIFAVSLRVGLPLLNLFPEYLRAFLSSGYQPASFIEAMDWPLVFFAVGGFVLGLYVVIQRKKKRNI